MLRIGLLLLMFGAWLGYSPASQASCSTLPVSASFGSVSSFTVTSTPLMINTSTGFTCNDKPILTILTANSATAVISTANGSGQVTRLLNGTNAIPYSLCKANDCNPLYQNGQSITWSSTALLDLLGLFSGPNNTLPLYLKTGISTNTPAGTYTDTITLNWSYHICTSVGVLGLCNYTDGNATSTITVTLDVSKDCFIDSAPNIPFGNAALPSAFTAINTAITVRCTTNATYSVNLASSVSEAGNWRQMMATVGGTQYYLQYQLLRGGVPWTSTNNYNTTGNGAAQSIPITAQINPGQPNVPAGSYSDTITVTVTY